jgi:hypothetical protein
LQNILSKTVRTFTAYLAVMFVVYCSVGVCSQMMAKAPSMSGEAVSAHAHHQMDSAQHESSVVTKHCDDTASCDWNLNPLTDGMLVLDDSAFFFAYLVLAVALIWQSTSARSLGWRGYGFFRERFFQYTYPRLHLQQAVFLN